jgi:hydroxymethylbilane synthase
MILTVGTRGSKLALAQTENVLKALNAIHPQLEFEIDVIKTLGDKQTTKALFTLDQKGIFEKEIDLAIEKGEVDFAVHSLKDVPILESSETTIAAIPKRNSPNDVLISKNNIPLAELPEGAVIGTCSLRRMAQTKHLRSDLEVKPIRGNVDTRIKKVKKGEYDAIILAEAGLKRMKLENQITERFMPDQFTPSAGQGALAVVARNDNKKILKLLESLNDAPSRAEVTAERSLVFCLEGGCRVPIGAIGRASGANLTFYGCIFSLDGKKKIFSSAEGKLAEAEDLGKQIGESLLKQGAKELEAEWREKYGTW